MLPCGMRGRFGWCCSLWKITGDAATRALLIAVPSRHRRSARYPRRMAHRIFGTAFSAVYPLYITKVERKGRTRAELDEVIRWLTGFDDAQLRAQVETDATIEEFFAAARLNPAADRITGVICGVRVEDIEDPLMQKIRYLDKLVDELARGKALAKVLRD